MPAPELRSDIFGSAVKARRVPGVSVLTPVKRSDRRGKEGYEGENEEKLYSRRVGIWDSDSDDDDDGLPEGMSPPKTMQFHIPQSKLLKTPGMCIVSMHMVYVANYMCSSRSKQTYR